MKLYLAKWYMEKAWMNLGSLRNTKTMHKLFNVAYSLRKAEYIEQIMALPVKGA